MEWMWVCECDDEGELEIDQLGVKDNGVAILPVNLISAFPLSFSFSFPKLEGDLTTAFIVLIGIGGGPIELFLLLFPLISAFNRGEEGGVGCGVPLVLDVGNGEFPSSPSTPSNPSIYPPLICLGCPGMMHSCPFAVYAQGRDRSVPGVGMPSLCWGDSNS